MNKLSIFDAGNPSPCPDPFNIADYVLAQAQETPDKSALEVYLNSDAPSEVWSYKELHSAVLGTAGGLRERGIGIGDRVLLRIGNSADFPVLFLAAIAIGAVPVPTSSQLAEPEVRRIIEELDPALICFAGGVAPLTDLTCDWLDQSALRALRSAPPTQPVPRKPDDLAYIIYTSGTSGKPRAVMHAQRSVWARRMMQEGWHGLHSDDRMLHAGAFNWTYTLGAGLLDPWAYGATTMIYAGSPNKTIWAALAREHHPTIFAAAPGVYRQVLQHPLSTDFASLRFGLSAGEKLPAGLSQRWQEQTGKVIYEALGMSEVATFISSSTTMPAIKGSSGRVQKGRRVAVLGAEGPVPLNTPGVLAVCRGDQGLMLGYRGQPTETAAKFQGEWFVTGDMVSMDAQGNITYLGRDDDMINAGGYRVSPLEIEGVLQGFDGITEVAAVAVQVKQEVSVIAAFYVSDDPIADNKLNTYCAARLARYKCPRIFTRIEALPKGANNKLRRKELR